MFSHALIWFLVYELSAFADDLVEMKIVDEPSSYGFNNNYQQWGGSLGGQNGGLKMRVMPANVSGPPHLARLSGRCFSKTIDNYKYDFCPFSNVTQHEQGYHWNPYKGVLGVWQEWEVENHTFVAMEMKEGDDCGSIHRSVKLVCGNTSEILSVSEPKTCHYLMMFSTPLVCHPHAMLVYPLLSPELRQRWDEIEGQKHRKELTDKGYRKRLQSILQDAGLRLTPAIRKQLSTEAVKADDDRRREVADALRGDFNSLAHCTQMYRRLQQEVEQLKAQLALYQG
ncbi:hypothetical protein BaRGS_00006821 [Batillaria attramentaria]|uniref:N-acetylglucosamine-1-phosphotransferase subunit gamma n=1 Tax=Batillaria attramentaria TaxID=370345 RepID=A0ABD0LQU8_9CAEN